MPPPLTAIVVPTRGRPDYLDVALASIAPQAAAEGAEVLVVDDGPDPATARVAARHGARYVAHSGPLGLNAARNTGLDATDAELVVLVDDDIAAHPGWLAALRGAAAALPEQVGVLTGPILARFEDHPLRSCGREGPPITHQDLGPADTDVPHAWGANLAVRRSALALAGRFDPSHEGAGDEEAWERRLRAGGGRIRYVAAAGVDHRRVGDDARLRNLARAAWGRGRTARRWGVRRGDAPAARAELTLVLRCLLHVVRFRCLNGVVLAAHAGGRLQEALDPAPPPATPGADDFLSGRSGTVAGWRAPLARATDLVLDARTARARQALRRAAAEPALPRRRVLVLGVERPGSRFGAARAELLGSRHDVVVHSTGVDGRGKFENLNALLREHPAAGHDWLLLVDDDVSLPRGFLDAFLLAAERADLQLAQPAHRRLSHAAWPHTRRRAGALGAARPTTLVEIGPVTALASLTFGVLLPFPPVRMGWGLDARWGAQAREHGWRAGIVDATPIAHVDRPAGDAYGRDAAIAEARALLDGHDYVTRDEVV